VGCHLCEDVVGQVEQVCAARGEAYVVRDVDEDAALVSRYGDLVPVVFVDGVEFATWRLDPLALDAALRRGGPSDG